MTPPPPQPARRRAGRSHAILEAFTRRVASYGYDGTHFGDIATELGISKGLIVHHYGTKDQLLLALHRSYMQRRLAEAHDITARLEQPPRQLAGLLYAFMLYQQVDRDATVAFQRETHRISQQPEGLELRRAYLELVRGILRAGQGSGAFRSGDVEQRSLFVLGTTQWAWTWFDRDGPASAVELGAGLVDLVLGGLLARRTALPALADPTGDVAATVASCLDVVGGAPT